MTNSPPLRRGGRLPQQRTHPIRRRRRLRVSILLYSSMDRAAASAPRRSHSARESRDGRSQDLLRAHAALPRRPGQCDRLLGGDGPVPPARAGQHAQRHRDRVLPLVRQPRSRASRGWQGCQLGRARRLVPPGSSPVPQGPTFLSPSPSSAVRVRPFPAMPPFSLPEPGSPSESSPPPADPSASRSRSVPGS